MIKLFLRINYWIIYNKFIGERTSFWTDNPRNVGIPVNLREQVNNLKCSNLTTELPVNIDRSVERYPSFGLSRQRPFSPRGHDEPCRDLAFDENFYDRSRGMSARHSKGSIENDRWPTRARAHISACPTSPRKWPFAERSNNRKSRFYVECSTIGALGAFPKLATLFDDYAMGILGADPETMRRMDRERWILSVESKRASLFSSI